VSKDDGLVLEQGSVDLHTPLYNSRIMRVYVEYLHQHYPEIDIDKVLNYAEVTRPELEDSAHWFSQYQVDRFHTKIAEKTASKNISHAVGRYAVSSEVLGIFKKIAISLVNPASVYMLIGKLYSLISRAVVVETKRVGDTRVEIAVSLNPGVNEKAYQCQNRIGSFEAIGRHFSNQYSKVDHPQCIHRGDPSCLYQVAWEKSQSLLWLRLRNIITAASALASIILLFVLPTSTWMEVSLLLGLAALSVQAYSQHLTIKDLRHTVKAQGDIAEEHLEGIKSQYNSSLLVEEIGSATSTLMDMQTLLETVAKVMKNRLSYDRGMLLLSDPKGQFLKYAAGYGFDQRETGLLNHINFRLTNPHSKGLFTQTFHAQKPFIVHDIDELKDRFSERSQRLITQFKSHSLVCVPIVYEKKSLGILVVDNKISNKKLQQRDLNLLKGIAANIATSINNSISYNKLMESEEKYRDMFENVSDFLYSHRLDGKILETNSTFKRATGYSEETLAAMNFGDLLPGRYTEQYCAYLDNVVKSGHAEGVTRILPKDGSELVVEYKNSLIVEDGKPVGVRGSARDITERWRSDRERKRLEGMLDRAKKMEAMGTLAGGVAHDLNNILSGIVSYPELMLLDLPTESKLREPIKIMMESGQKASAMVQDLLTMARRGVTSMEVLNLNDIINEYLGSPEYRKISEYHPAVRFRVDTDPNLLNFEGSAIHLFKTLMNLISNAAEAMPAGGELSISSRNQYVDQAIQGFDDVTEGDYTVLSVSDTGIGISEEDQKHIFEPFYTKKVMGRSGTGLGMSVVWATVKDHKGQIDIRSRIGDGTTIRLYFPATRKAKLSPTDIISLDRYKGNDESVLVVDDVKEQREIASLMLSKLGYRVATVPSGEKAVEYLEKQKADLVVLDMIMDPGIDGLETFQQIRKTKPNQKAIIVSGYSDSEKVRQAQKIGAGAYLKKPYVLAEIGKAVRSELDS
jgi:PAS domain S-box-containing protein